MNVGSKIKELRLKQNLKQSELAEKAEISRVTLGNYERGTRVPHIVNLKKIANALNVNVNELITPMYELEEALMNDSDNISELVDKVKKTNKEEVIHYFRELIDSAHWGKLKNVSDEDIYSVVMSVELYAYLQGLFDMQRKENQENLILDKAINIANSKLSKTDINDLNNLSEIEQKAILEKGLKIANKILKNKEDD